MRQAHVFISGFVQNVGFRHFIRSRAKKFSVAGWVKNLPDKTVEAVFQGDKNSISKIIEDCKKGPFLSEVEDVQINWEETVDKLDDFMVL